MTHPSLGTFSDPKGRGFSELISAQPPYTWQRGTSYTGDRSGVRASFVINKVHHMKVRLTVEWETQQSRCGDKFKNRKLQWFYWEKGSVYETENACIKTVYVRNFIFGHES